ncbi:MAG TPA: hypothetical protein PLD31_00110 [Streptococcus parasuis]|nr:hypothetical protein [Streptococcus parasuis]
MKVRIEFDDSLDQVEVIILWGKYFGVLFGLYLVQKDQHGYA